MRKRVLILLIGLVAVAIAAAVWQQAGRVQDPIYQGKRLSLWLEGLNPFPVDDLALKQPTQRRESEEAVKAIGTNAVPLLIRMLQASDSTLWSYLRRQARKSRFIRIGCTSADVLNYRAAMAFEILGSDASNSIPALTRTYDESRSEYSQNAAVLAMRSIGEPGAVPCLLRAATNCDSAIRDNALAALGEIRAHPELVVPVLLKALRDPDPIARTAAMVGLGQFGADAKSAVPLLLEILNGKSWPPDRGAYDALKKIDPAAAAKVDME